MLSKVYLGVCLELFADWLSPAVENICPETRNSKENGYGGELTVSITVPYLNHLKCGKPASVLFCYFVRYFQYLRVLIRRLGLLLGCLAHGKS